MSRPSGSVARISTSGLISCPFDRTRKLRKFGSVGGRSAMLCGPLPSSGPVVMPPGVMRGTSGIGKATRKVTGWPVSLRIS